MGKYFLKCITDNVTINHNRKYPFVCISLKLAIILNAKLSS
jgi:hypothetical protein